MDDGELVSALENLGMTYNQAKVYLHLTSNGKSTANEVKSSTGINRAVVYSTLQELVQKGLVHYVHSEKSKHFVASDASKLLSDAQEKMFAVQSLIPKLKNLEPARQAKVRVEILEGKESLKQIYRDIISTGQDWLDLGLTGTAPTTTSPQFMAKIHQLRVSSKIVLRAIVNSTQTGISRAKELSKMPTTKIHFLPKNMITNEATHVYGDKVAIILYLTNPIAILVESRQIAQYYRKHFELLWKMSSSKPEK